MFVAKPDMNTAAAAAAAAAAACVVMTGFGVLTLQQCSAFTLGGMTLVPLRFSAGCYTTTQHRPPCLVIIYTSFSDNKNKKKEESKKCRGGLTAE